MHFTSHTSHGYINYKTDYSFKKYDSTTYYVKKGTYLKIFLMHFK